MYILLVDILAPGSCTSHDEILGPFTRCNIPHAIVILAYENDCQPIISLYEFQAKFKMLYLYTHTVMTHSITFAKIRIACDMSHRPLVDALGFFWSREFICYDILKSNKKLLSAAV